jgi:hypothetical protein
LASQRVFLCMYVLETSQSCAVTHSFTKVLRKFYESFTKVLRKFYESFTKVFGQNQTKTFKSNHEASATKHFCARNA